MTTSMSFEDYLNSWNKYLIVNNTKDWFEEEDDEVESKSANSFDNEFVIVTKKKSVKKTNYNKNDIFHNGKIIKWWPDKNFGFIRCSKFPSKDIFCHGSNILGKPVIGTKVKINVCSNNKGGLIANKCLVF